MSDRRDDVQYGKDITLGIVKGVLVSVVFIVLTINVIFIHKASKDPATLEKLFPTNNHTGLITTWFIGRLISEIAYKSLDANNRNIHRFFGGLTEIESGIGYIFLTFIIGGIFFGLTAGWFVYGAVITFIQAFIFNMTLPVGWIRSLIILYSVGFASLISGAIASIYNFVMMIYLPIYYSNTTDKTLAKCENLNMGYILSTYVTTFSFMLIVTVTYFIGRELKTKHSFITYIIICLTIVIFYFLERNKKYVVPNLGCPVVPVEVDDDPDVVNEDFIQLLRNPSRQFVSDQDVIDLQNDFTSLIYKRLLNKGASEGVTNQVTAENIPTLADGITTSKIKTPSIQTTPDIQDTFTSLQDTIKETIGALTPAGAPPLPSAPPAPSAPPPPAPPASAPPAPPAS